MYSIVWFYYKLKWIIFAVLTSKRVDLCQFQRLFTIAVMSQASGPNTHSYVAILIVPPASHRKWLLLTMYHTFTNSSHRIKINDLKFGLNTLKTYVSKSYQKLPFSIWMWWGNSSGAFCNEKQNWFEGKGISVISPNLTQYDISHMLNINVLNTFEDWVGPNGCVVPPTKFQLSSSKNPFDIELLN